MEFGKECLYITRPDHSSLQNSIPLESVSSSLLLSWVLCHSIQPCPMQIAVTKQFELMQMLQQVTHEVFLPRFENHFVTVRQPYTIEGAYESDYLNDTIKFTFKKVIAFWKNKRSSSKTQKFIEIICNDTYSKNGILVLQIYAKK